MHGAFAPVTCAGWVLRDTDGDSCCLIRGLRHSQITGNGVLYIFCTIKFVQDHASGCVQGVVHGKGYRPLRCIAVWRCGFFGLIQIVSSYRDISPSRMLGRVYWLPKNNSDSRPLPKVCRVWVSIHSPANTIKRTWLLPIPTA